MIALHRERTAAQVKVSVTSVPRAMSITFVVIGLLGSIHLLAMIGIEVTRYAENTQEINRLNAANAALEEEVAGLQAILDHANDARYREQLARRQGFVFPDEQRFFTRVLE